MTQPLNEFCQQFHNLIMRLSITRSEGQTFNEEEALLYNEACRYMASVAKALRMSQEDYNKSQEEKDDNDGERPIGV